MLFQEIRADTTQNHNYPVDSFASQYQYASQNQASPNLGTNEYPTPEVQHNLGHQAPVVGEKQDLEAGITSVLGPEASVSRHESNYYA